MPTNDTMTASFNEALRNFREHLCEMQMAYEDMDGAVRIHPWAQEFADKYLHALAQQFTNPTNPTNQPIQQPTMTVQGNLIVNGDYIEAGANKTVNIEHYHGGSDHTELTQEGEFTQKMEERPSEGKITQKMEDVDNVRREESPLCNFGSFRREESPLCNFPPHSGGSEGTEMTDHSELPQEGRPELPEESKVDSLTREVERLKGCLMALQLPRENSYVELVDWLEREKQAGRDWYREADYNRSQMARNLSDYLGWVVDYTTLSRAINRR